MLFEHDAGTPKRLVGTLIAVPGPAQLAGRPGLEQVPQQLAVHLLVPPLGYQGREVILLADRKSPLGKSLDRVKTE